MPSNLSRTLTALDRCRVVLESALGETSGSPEQRVQRVARSLHELRPAPLYACHLQNGHGTAFAAVKATGDPLGEGLEPVRRELTALSFDRVSAPLPDMPGQRLVARPIELGSRRFGALASVVPEAAPEAELVQILQFLDACASRLAAGLAAEAAEDPTERQRLAWLGNISELTSVITHEFNNVLNGMLLHIAVVKQEVPPEIVRELDVIRGLGINAAALIKKLQQYNSKRRGALTPVDLNDVIREVLGRHPDLKSEVELASDLPPVQARPADLARLVELLASQAAASTPAGGTVRIRTCQEGKRVQLRVEDAGPHLPDEQLPHAFEPFQVARSGGDEAELSVCHTLARHLQGSLRAENLTPVGMAFTLELSPTKE